MSCPALRAPVVLVHGLWGFASLRLGPLVLADYFRGIPRALRKAGNRVLVARLSPAASVAERAVELRDLIDRELPGEAVHLFAHSLGGLDSRYLISRLGMAARVLSLTTLGTPHRGTAFADWGIARLERLARPVFDFLRIPYRAVYDLTTRACAEFNRTTPDAPGVRYFSVAGCFPLHWSAPQWALPGKIVELAEGPNDGIVSLASARYGEDCQEWDGDHMDLVNWPRPWRLLRQGGNRLTDYVRLVQRLADEGF
jgi:triacylglycerol lipase